MDITDKIVGGIVAFAFIGFGVPLAIGFINDGNFTLSVDGETYALGKMIILLVIVFVLGLVYLIYKNTKGK